MSTARTRIVVLGGGFGGVVTIRHLLQSSFVRDHCEIILVDRTPTHVFTPWLYEIASGSTAALSGERRELGHSAGFPLASLLGPKGSRVQFRHVGVVGCDVEGRQVLLDGGRTLAFGVLVIALGSETAFFGIPGLKEHAHCLKSLHDASTINCRLTTLIDGVRHGERSSAHIVIGGAGPSGIELASELRTMLNVIQKKAGIPREAIRITVLSAGPRVLEMASPKVSRLAHTRLQAIGAEVVLDTVLTKATERSITVQPRPRRADEIGSSVSPYATPTEVACDLLVWCGGVTPNSILANFALPKDPKGRIQVGPTFEVTGHTNIFVIGDAACLVNPRDPRPLPATAHAAEVTAETVAHNVIRAIQRRALKPFRMPRWPLVVMVGAKWGIADLFGFVLIGWFGYMLRRGADLRYFLRLLSPWSAVQMWRKRVKLYGQNDQ